MAARGPPGGARGGLNNRFAQFKLVLLGMSESATFVGITTNFCWDAGESAVGKVLTQPTIRVTI